MEHELSTHKAVDLVSVIEHHDIGDILKPFIKEIHLFDSYIAGTTHLKDQSVLEEIREDDKLNLQREDNRYDSNAILVLAPDGRKLGYIPEKDNVIFARLMDAGKLLSARIRSIMRRGSFTQVKIGIYLVDF